MLEVRETDHGEAVVRRARPTRAWRAVSEGRVLGVVVLFEEGAGETGRFFSVRNAWMQDLGMIDDTGRAWAFRPHEEQPVWLTTGTVAEGAAEILGAAACELLEIPIDELSTGR